MLENSQSFKMFYFDYPKTEIYYTSTGPVKENSYLLVDKFSQQAVLIDPGEDYQKILAMIKDNFKIQKILLTHGHFDHIGAVQALREILNVEVGGHELINDDYNNAKERAAMFGIEVQQPTKLNFYLKQNDTIEFGETKLTVRELFGHAQGHVIFKGKGFVIAGDTVFKGSIGRTDLPGSDHLALIEGIKYEIQTLNDETIIFSGHGEPTSVAIEKQNNPFFR